MGSDTQGSRSYSRIPSILSCVMCLVDADSFIRRTQPVQFVANHECLAFFYFMLLDLSKRRKITAVDPQPQGVVRRIPMSPSSGSAN